MLAIFKKANTTHTYTETCLTSMVRMMMMMGKCRVLIHPNTSKFFGHFEKKAQNFYGLFGKKPKIYSNLILDQSLTFLTVSNVLSPVRYSPLFSFRVKVTKYWFSSFDDFFAAKITNFVNFLPFSKIEIAGQNVIF